MLRINLVPNETVKSTLWWTVPCLLGTTLAFMLIIGTRLYLNTLLLQTTVLSSRQNELNTEIESYKNQNKDFDVLDKELKKLAGKIDALKHITTSKLASYKPLIIIDLLQSLKPTQIWFRYLFIDKGPINTPAPEDNNAKGKGKDKTKDKKKPDENQANQNEPEPSIRIEGYSTDPEAISLFIGSLEKTAQVEFNPSDLKTQILFKDINLNKFSTAKTTSNILFSNTEKKDVEITSFEISCRYEERVAATPSQEGEKEI